MEKEARGEAWDCWPAFLLSPVWRLPGLKVQQVPALVQDGAQLHHRFRLPFLRLPSLRRQKFLPLHWEGDYECNTRMEHGKYGWSSPLCSWIQSEIKQNQKALSDFFHCLLTHSFQFSLYPLSFPLYISATLHGILHKGKTQYKLTAYQNGTFWHFRTTSSAWGVSKRHASNVTKLF